MAFLKALRPGIVLPMRGPRETNQLGSVIGLEATSSCNKHQVNLSVRPIAVGDESEPRWVLQHMSARPVGRGQRINFGTIYRAAAKEPSRSPSAQGAKAAACLRRAPGKEEDPKSERFVQKIARSVEGAGNDASDKSEAD